MAVLQTNYYGLANFTPYTMTSTYQAASQTGDEGFTPFDANLGATPAQTIPPGANMVFVLFTDMGGLGIGPVGGNYAAAELHYDFTDVDGGQHRCLYKVAPDKSLHVDSMDLSDGTYVESTATFYISASSSEPDQLRAQPWAEVTIDAVQDPVVATSVLANLWPQGTNKQFTATTPLTFVTGDFTRGSAIVQNTSEGQVQLTYGGGVTAEETTSIGWQVSWALSWDILGIVNEQVSGSVTGAKNWSTSYSTTQDYTVVIPPQQQGWLKWAVTSAEITGDLTFTWTPPSGAVTPAGITYHITNATVTQPGQNVVPRCPWPPGKSTSRRFR